MLADISELITSSGDRSKTLQKVLDILRTSVCGNRLVLVCPDENVQCASADSAIASSPDEIPEFIRILHVTEGNRLNIPLGDGAAEQFASSFLCGDSDNPRSLVCLGKELSTEEYDFLTAAAHLLCRFLRSTQAADSSGSAEVIKMVSAIHSINEAMGRMPIDDLLTLITEKAAEVMDAQACSLMLRENGSEELAIRASCGISTEIADEARVLYGRGIAGRVAQTGEPMLLHDLAVDSRFSRSDVVPRPEIVSSISVPLRDAEGRIHGVLNISRQRPSMPFNGSDVRVFAVFASQAALVVSNAYLYGSLRDRLDEMSLVYQAGVNLSEAGSVEAASITLANFATTIGVFDAAIISLWDKPPVGSIQARIGISSEERQRLAQSIDESAAEWIGSIRKPKGWLLRSDACIPKQIRKLADTFVGRFGWFGLVPLVSEDEVLGVLIVASGGECEPSVQGLRTISIVSSQAAMVIRNTRRYERELDQHVLEFSALYKMSEEIGSAANFEEAAECILDVVSELVECDECMISTIDVRRERIKVEACRGLAVKGTEFPAEEEQIICWVVNERKARVFSDLWKEAVIGPSRVRSERVRSLMVIPLVVHGSAIGVLCVRSFRPGMYAEDEVRALSIVASQAAALYMGLQDLNSLTRYTENILGSIATGVSAVDRDGNVVIYNQAAEQIMRMPASEVLGRHYSSVVSRILLPPDERNILADALQSVIETGERFVGYKSPIHPNDDEEQYINVSISQLRARNGEPQGLVIVFDDVTDQVRMESDIKRISDLAAIGQLAANIAHEIRNPLSSIKGAAQYLRREYSEQVVLGEFLDIIIEEVNVLNGITTEFLEFARPPKMNVQDVDINTVVARTLQFMQSETDSQNIRTVLSLGTEIPCIPADERQMEQVFRNLFLNAIQSMPNGGSLIVRTSVDGGTVLVSVCDEGIGMERDVVDQIFVPFFTTKTKGTGLGLSVVLKTIESHGGKISVDSIPGKGTGFNISLPVRVGVFDPAGCVDLSQEEIGLFRRSHGSHKGK